MIVTSSLTSAPDTVARKITEFLKGYDRFAKTIVFCVDIDHAERMRSAIARHNADLVAINHKYVMQITGDNDEGKRELDNFILPEEKYPVIATTSELMTTGRGCTNLQSNCAGQRDQVHDQVQAGDRARHPHQ